MRNPWPINLMTPEESRALGWQAEARDTDGHLISQHAPFGDSDSIEGYVRDETGRGHTVTIWPVTPSGCGPIGETE